MIQNLSYIFMAAFLGLLFVYAERNLPLRMSSWPLVAKHSFHDQMQNAVFPSLFFLFLLLLAGSERINEVLFLFLLLLAARIDQFIRKIPNEIPAAGVFIFFLYPLLTGSDKKTPLLTLVGSFLVTGVLLLFTLLLEEILQKEVLGGGDLKLLFVIYLYINGTAFLYLLFLSFLGALLCMIGKQKERRKEKLALGPFLFAAALFSLLFL